MNAHTQTIASNETRFLPLLTTGFALFSMFFGAGNLIFPLLIGKTAAGNIWFAIAGLGITAVAMPFLGLIAMILFQANYYSFFNRLGKIPGSLLVLFLQLILGPFGVIPRLVSLMQGIVKFYAPETSSFLLSTLICLIIFVFSFRKNQLIQILGAYLTPILLMSLLVFVFFGLATLPPRLDTISSQFQTFWIGLVGGYNTMDLIAAFLFATVILPHFQNQPIPGNSRPFFRQLLPSVLIAASLLLLTYIGLCLVSSRYDWGSSPDLAAEQMLSTIAVKLLGGLGGLIASIAVITACLTTAITLTTIFASYLQNDLLQGKISPSAALSLTLISTTLFSSLGFEGLAIFLGPILQIVYPCLILLTFLNLFYFFTEWKAVKAPVILAFISSLIFYFFQIKL